MTNKNNSIFLFLFLSLLFSFPTSAQDWHRSDINNDGIVNSQDLMELQNSWHVAGEPLEEAVSPWQISGSSIFYSSGNVGIGTANPQVELDVIGNIRAHNSSGKGAVNLSSDADGGILDIYNSLGNRAGNLWVNTDGGGLITLNDPEGYRLLSLYSDQDGGILSVENNSGNVVSQFWVNSTGVGLLTLNDNEGNRRTNLFSDSIGGILEAENFNGQSAARMWVTDEGGGLVTLNDPDGNLCAQFSVIAEKAGDLRLDGPNGNTNISAGATANNFNHGIITVNDSNGNTRAQMFVDAQGNGRVETYNSKGKISGGITTDQSGQSILWANKTLSVEDYPGKTDYKIIHSSLEGREPTIVCKGKLDLVEGRATLELPEDFLALAIPESLNIQLTPESFGSKGVGFEKTGKNEIQIGELFNGTGSYPVHYVVSATKIGEENFKTVLTNEEFKMASSQIQPIQKTERDKTFSPTKKIGVPGK